MEKLSSIFKKLDHLLTSIEKIILVFIFSVMIVLAFSQVILREFFSSGFLWGDTFLRHGVLWIGFMGAAIATFESKHFSIDFLKKSLSPKTKIISQITTDFFALVVLFFLSGSAVKFFKDELSFRSVLFTVGNLEVPSFWMNSIIPFGFILIMVHFFLKTVEDILRFFSVQE